MKITRPIDSISETSAKTSLKLEAGDKIKGKIIEIEEGFIKLEIGKGKVLYGKLDLPLELSAEKLMSFKVKGVFENLITLTPDYGVTEDESVYSIRDEKVIMEKVLDSLGLKSNSKTLDLLRTMIRLNMPLDRDSVYKNIKYMDKLESLFNLKKDEKVLLIADESSFDSQDILKLVKTKSEDAPPEKLHKYIDSEKPKSNSVYAEKKSEPHILSLEEAEKLKELVALLDKGIEKKVKSALSNISETSGEKSGKSNNIEVTHEIKSQMERIFPDREIGLKDMQRLVFLIKAGVKISLNNIADFNRFLNGEDMLEDVELLVKQALEGNILDKDEVKSLESLKQKLKMDFKSDGMENIKKYNENLSEIISRISEKTKNLESGQDKLIKTIDSLNDKIEMQNRINDKAMINLIPLNLDKSELADKLYFMSKRKHGKKSEDVTAYLSLHTEKLNTVKVLCRCSSESLNIRFSVDKDKVELFESTKASLSSSLSEIGFSTVFINISESIEMDLLENLMEDKTISYVINVKV